MKFIKLLILLSCLCSILNSCSSFSDVSNVLRNEKGASGDEFLIKKKEALTTPPDFRKIPEPGSVENAARSEQNSIEKILNKNKSESTNNRAKSSSTEESILKKIKK